MATIRPGTQASTYLVSLLFLGMAFTACALSRDKWSHLPSVQPEISVPCLMAPMASPVVLRLLRTKTRLCATRNVLAGRLSSNRSAAGVPALVCVANGSPHLMHLMVSGSAFRPTRSDCSSESACSSKPGRQKKP
jgi:hypothetical protein